MANPSSSLMEAWWHCEKTDQLVQRYQHLDTMTLATDLEHFAGT